MAWARTLERLNRLAGRPGENGLKAVCPARECTRAGVYAVTFARPDSTQPRWFHVCGDHRDQVVTELEKLGFRARWWLL